MKDPFAFSSTVTCFAVDLFVDDSAGHKGEERTGGDNLPDIIWQQTVCAQGEFRYLFCEQEI